MSKATLATLIASRDAIADKLEFIENEIKQHGVTKKLDEGTTSIYIQELDHWKERLDATHNSIRSLSPTDMDDHKKDYFTLLETISSLQQRLRGIKATFPATTPTHSASTPGGSTHSQAMKLPKLELQPFHGDYLDWNRFKDTFEAAVHNNKHLGKVEKFSYLLTLLKGEASRQCAELALTDANYDIAWTQLHDRYQNQHKISEAILEQFLLHPISNGSSKAIKGLLDSAKRCIRSMEQLGLIMHSSAEVFYVYHLASKLDNSARDLWKHTLKDNSIPKFKEMCDFLERHASALEDSGKNQVSKNSNNNRKVNVHLTQQPNEDKQSRPCVLGCNHSHPVHRCRKFLAASVSERYDTLRTKKLCYICFKEGHRTDECSCTFKCKKCSKPHHALLHPTSNQNNKPREPEQQQSQKITTALHTADNSEATTSSK